MKRVLLTGASSGIGEALASLLAKEGFSLILSGRQQEKLEKLAFELKAEEVIIADLNSVEQREKLICCVRSRLPELVINNAGFGIYGDALSIPVNEQLDILRVNAEAPLELTLEAARALVAAKKEGVIMNISSVAGDYPSPGMSVYGAAKAFLTSVSQALNTELSSKGVHVLVSCPGMVASDFASRAAKKKIRISRRGAVLTPEYAAKQILKQIISKKEKLIFSYRYRMLSWLATYLVPTSYIKKIIWKEIQKRL